MVPLCPRSEGQLLLPQLFVGFQAEEGGTFVCAFGSFSFPT